FTAFEQLTHVDMADKIPKWWQGMFALYGSPWRMLAVSVLLFPKLALGMSGFETGVAVMPLVKGNATDNPEQPESRIRNTRKLLACAALIMSVFLLASSFVSTVLIAPEKFQHEANGRALSYLAHSFMSQGFATAYDISTVLILWFAGASAMTGLLNLVPRYLPRYGMAPEWARATRPLVVFFTAIGCIVTWWFKADVNAQGGAYATGVLVLMTSAAFACTLTVWRTKPFQRIAYSAITDVFIYTMITNCIERPEGLQIAALFILTIFSASLVSRAIRATELRVQKISFDPTAQRFVDEAKASFVGQVRILAHRPGGTNYATKECEARETHSIQQPEGNFIFLEVRLKDASDFLEDCLDVTGHEEDGFQVMRCSSPAIPNAIAAILLHIRDHTNTIPNAYFGWTEGNPIGYIFKYIFFGEGETAPVTREILRELEANPKRRPTIHVG
ncbi:MAG: amino acid transporter, partial [Terriglobales bacterium]